MIEICVSSTYIKVCGLFTAYNLACICQRCGAELTFKVRQGSERNVKKFEKSVRETRRQKYK